MSQLPIERPTKEAALAALHDMGDVAVWGPGVAGFVTLVVLGQSAPLCAVAVATTLYFSRLWGRLEKKEKGK